MVAVAIVVALVAAVGGWWWINRETGPQVGDQAQVTARVDELCVCLSLEFKGTALAGQAEWSADGGIEWPTSWRGQEVDGILEVTERDGGWISGRFTSDGTEVPVHSSPEGTFESGPTVIWG